MHNFLETEQIITSSLYNYKASETICPCIDFMLLDEIHTEDYVGTTPCLRQNEEQFHENFRVGSCTVKIEKSELNIDLLMGLENTPIPYREPGRFIACGADIKSRKDLL